MTRRGFAAALALACLPGTARAGDRLLIIGDCIATRAGLGGQFPGATVDAKVGIVSADVIARARPGFAAAIVSAGTNDITRRTSPKSTPRLQARLRANLAAIRSRLGSASIVWVAPVFGPAGDIVRAFAAEHGDHAVTFRAGPDGYHPASYPEVASRIAPILGLAAASRPAAPHHHH